MQLISLEKGRTTRLFWLVAVLLGALLMLYTGKQDDPGVVATGLLWGSSRLSALFLAAGLVARLADLAGFRSVNGIFAALPMIQDPENLAVYTSGEIMTGGLTLLDSSCSAR